jgi:Rod binding domain-containing protein
MANISSLLPTVPANLLTPSLRGVKAARDFEAILIGSVLESMEKTLAALPGQNSLTGTDDYNYLGTQALAQALAARGGFGIAALIARYLPAHEGNG